ncbi:beta-lactamase/transpeptidase-like protein [Mycena maculata]|uniref:Beta-lactamase/transpeptidase-like protein n=1 Tax=Mycena maculata TaxID=230809 RepID=A0AAD7NLS1_9AGAR|nr:beta-lactamase/transpeptidase-like protein [Mycena maculata]
MHLLRILAGVPVVAAAAANFGRLQRPFKLFDTKKQTNLLNAEVDSAINSILKDFKSPGGVGVAVVRRHKDRSGWNVETKGYGNAKVDGTKVTSDTLFPIGSNSKLFDILATGLLISNESLSKRISWDTKIASFVPEWGLMDPVASAESTIVDVMSHRTGLPRHDFILSLSETVSNSIRRLRYLRPSTGFRELWQYNNHMYTLISHFPQLLVGIPFETYVNDFIIEPLGMRSTTYFSGKAEESGNLADGMARDGVNQTKDVFGQGTVRALPFWAPNKGDPGHVLSGAGGVISNANDLAIWLQMLLNEGQHPTINKTVVPPEVIRRVATGVTVAGPVAPFPELSPIVYGGGQSRGTYRGFEYIEHGGSTPVMHDPCRGFKSQIIRIPTQDLGVAVLSNDESFGTQIMEAIKFRILDEALKLQVVDWSGRLRSLTTAGFNGRTIPTPRPENATLPSFPFADLVGKYRDPGYGNIELCFVSLGTDFLPSESCRQLLEELPVTLPDTLDPQIPTLLARWNKVELTYVSAAHFDHNLFNLSAISSMPTGNSSDRPYWVSVESSPSLVAEFGYDGILGVGMRGGMWGAGDGVDSPAGKSVKERAEVWFEKVTEAH